MIISKQIYTGGAGECGGFLRHAATAASTSQVNVKQQAHWLLTQNNQSAAPCDDVIEFSERVRPIGLCHLEFHTRTLDLTHKPIPNTEPLLHKPYKILCFHKHKCVR